MDYLHFFQRTIFTFPGVMEFTRGLQQTPFSEIELQVGFSLN